MYFRNNLVSLSPATTGGTFDFFIAAGRWIIPMAFFMPITQSNNFSGYTTDGVIIGHIWGYIGRRTKPRLSI